MWTVVPATEDPLIFVGKQRVVAFPITSRLRQRLGRQLMVAFCACGVITVLIGNFFVDVGVGYIDAAVPSFFFLMWFEHHLTRRLDAQAKAEALDSCGGVGFASHYTVKDTWSSLTAGAAQQFCFEVFKRAFVMSSLFACFHERFQLVSFLASLMLPSSVAADSAETMAWIHKAFANHIGVRVVFYIYTFILGDFVYYWFHRLSHEINFLWAGHSVHHNSDRYNLSTALRQSAWQAYFGAIFNLSMAMLTLPEAYLVTASWVTLYQFWPHTCLIRRLPPWVELIFVTPSHHRVHHDRRVHKNFAGVFIVWDRVRFTMSLIIRPFLKGMWMENVVRRRATLVSRSLPRAGAKGHSSRCCGRSFSTMQRWGRQRCPPLHCGAPLFVIQDTKQRQCVGPYPALLQPTRSDG